MGREERALLVLVFGKGGEGVEKGREGKRDNGDDQ